MLSYADFAARKKGLGPLAVLQAYWLGWRSSDHWLCFMWSSHGQESAVH